MPDEMGATSTSGRWLAWPPLAYLVVFFLVPMALVVRYSVLERDFYGDVKPAWSAEGWRQATSPATLTILGRSLGLAAAVTGICLLVGYPCAASLARLGPRGRQFTVVLVGFPLVTSLLLRIYGWMNLLPLEWRGTLWCVALVMSANYLPFMVLPLLRAWERLDPNLPQAAMDLGATPWQTFWRVSWPLTRPGMWAGCALVFIPAAGEYLVPHFIGEGKVLVLGTLIVQQFMERRNWPYASAAAIWLLLLVTVPLVIAALRRTARRSSP
jgi:spermidine/putrescine transport system permease protein